MVVVTLPFFLQALPAPLHNQRDAASSRVPPRHLDVTTQATVRAFAVDFRRGLQAARMPRREAAPPMRARGTAVPLHWPPVNAMLAPT